MTRGGIDRRIFVVGAPRSGTTLVQSLLATHSAVTSFTESHFFSRHFRLLPGLSTPILTRDPGPRLREFLAENATRLSRGDAALEEEAGRISSGRRLGPFRTRAVAGRLLRVLDRLTVLRGHANWVEKTPRHLRYVPFLERVLGGGGHARFVHVIRRGVEVVPSLHVASRDWERPYDVQTCVRRWNADLRLSLARVASPTDHFVFYDELTSQPRAAVRRLLAALDLGWEPRMLESFDRSARRLVTSVETWKRVPPHIRHAEPSDRVLTAAQRARVDATLRHGLYDQLQALARRGAGGTRYADAT